MPFVTTLWPAAFDPLADAADAEPLAEPEPDMDADPDAPAVIWGGYVAPCALISNASDLT
jgi:hypothetical protein